MVAPVVTGISPKEGPPGTRVTIRGENLGTSPQDVIGLTICGADCLLSAEWIAPNKIIGRSRLAKGRGDVIVTTKSGGRGTCTIQFHSLTETIGPLKETAVWIDESQFFGNASNRKRAIVPSFLNQDNPLGLSDEGNVKKFPEDELHEMFPDGSGNLSSENFIPLWFLVECHFGASFQDLQAGLNCLKRKVNTQKEGELSFLKANVGAVLDQLDTLRALQTQILNDKATLGSISTTEIENAVKTAKSEADSLFKDVLGRRDRAEATRNTLSVLQRFKFLFNLPCTIERNIQKGDYDVVINDYTRAKSLFSDTEVSIFKKVYQEVEQRIANFRKMLIERLQDRPVQLNKQLRLIRYLINLETPGDPAWDCIIFQKNYIVKSLEDCKKLHLSQDKSEAENLSLRAKMTNGGRSGSLPPAATRPGERRGSHYGRSETWQEQIPHRVVFVEDICNTIVQEFSNLWKLGQSYLSGDLLAKEVGAGGFQKLGANKGKEFLASMLNVMQSFCHHVQGALQDKGRLQEWSPSTLDATKLYLPQCIQQIKVVYASMNELDLPKEILNLVQQLLFDLRMDCLVSMFTKAEDEVKNLHSREMWTIEFDVELGGITQLPLIYENTVLKTIQLVNEVVLQVGPHEKELLGNPSAEKVVVNRWRDLLLGFSHALKHLSRSVTVSPIANGEQNKINHSDTFGNREKSAVISGIFDSSISPEQLLLVILGNCNYTKQHILPRLYESYHKHGFPKAENVEIVVQKNFVDLDNAIFDMYCELKCEPIVGAIEQRMYVGHFDWSKCSKVVGVRVYVKEILMELNAVHYELHCVSQFVVKRAINRIVESVCEEIARLFACIEHYSIPGGVQARVDIKSLELAFCDFMTESSRKSLQEVLESLPPVRTGCNFAKNIDDEVKKFQQRMKYQLMCFRNARN